MRLVDTHTHTFPFSPDAEASLEEHAAAAEWLGLGGFILTDHCDMVPWQDIGCAPYWADFDRDGSFNILSEVRERHPGLYIGFGAELGEWYADVEPDEAVPPKYGADGRLLPPHAPVRSDAIASDPRLDFLLGSMHTVRREDFSRMTFTSEEQCAELLRLYAERLVSHCENSPMDALAHLTYPLRYMRRAGFRADLTRERDTVAEALRALVRRGKALEVNTSGLRQGHGETLPGKYWLELWRDLGGELVTLGSDAHYSRDLAADFAAAAELLRACGFRYAFYYRELRPVAIPLG